MHIEVLRTPCEKLQLLESFDPRRATWVVPDMETKHGIQRYLLAREQPGSRFLLGESVLRASELWTRLLTRVRPDLNVISPDLARNWIADFLDESPYSWARTPGAPKLLYDYIGQLMPVLSHPEGDDQIREWFQARPESLGRWGHWYELAQAAWREFLNRGLVAAPWVSGVLVNEFGFERVWSRPLIFDLGVELIEIESDLIQNLSRYTEVTVLEPRPSWANRYERSLQPYDHLDPLPVRAAVNEAPEADPAATCHKFSTMLSEVKFATAQLRQWADQGIALEHMGLVMPDIELYWPTLKFYLKEEGLPVQKKHVASLHTLPDVARWLAQLRLRSGRLQTSDLELCTFWSKPEVPIGFDRFRRLFSQIYGHQDLARDQKFFQLYSQNLSHEAPLDRDEFVAWSLQFWFEGRDPLYLERIYRQLFQECPQNLPMKLRRWIQFVEQIAARCEITVAESLPHGIAISNLTSTDSLSCTHVILLGLSESALRKVSSTSIIYGDVLSVAAQLGFHLSYPDQNKLEFATRWLLEDNRRQFHLCFPASDFSGAAQAPSLVWLELAIEQHAHEQIVTPPLTRWDEMQQAELAQLATVRDWPEAQQIKLLAGIECDMGLVPAAPFQPAGELKLSASSLENYLKCPFAFAAEKLFKLADVEALDLDVDARTRGQLMHAVFEALLKKPDLDWSELHLTELIDTCRALHDIEIGDEGLWPPLRAKYVALAKRFLAFERDYRAQFPHMKTKGVEVQVEGYLYPDGSLQREWGVGAFAFRGKIDRVDHDGAGHAVILDYKTSRSGDKICPAPSWVNKHSLQLALYAMAVEAGIVRDHPDAAFWPGEDVVGAFFYIAKNLNRDVGLRLEEYENVLYPGNRYMRRLNREGKNALWSEIQELVRAQLTRLSHGDFAPKPHKTETCDRCQWSSLCRAPHLN